MSEWIGVDTIEDIEVVGEEILVFDGCDIEKDYVEVCPEYGVYYMANGTEPTHWMPMPLPPNTSDH